MQVDQQLDSVSPFYLPSPGVPDRAVCVRPSAWSMSLYELTNFFYCQVPSCWIERLTLQKWLLIMYFWAREYPVTDVAEEAEVDQHTAIDIYQWLREVGTTRLLQDAPIILGGPGKMVQIDESLFKHKPKVIKRTIYVKF